MSTPSNTEVAIFGGGCFWCSEAVFEDLKGVVHISPGYAGGDTIAPTYEDICGGATGHAEVIRIEFDPTIISYEDLLTVFFASHDLTTLNRQGNDVGTQYRSIILYTTSEQKNIAEKFIEKLNQNTSEKKVVTELTQLDVFTEAEDYHHQYFKKNPEAAYCQFVINPKLQHVKERFSQLMHRA